MLQVCVVGTGALGALYGFVLERSNKVSVTVVCRSLALIAVIGALQSSNYDLVKNHGIDIRSDKHGNIDAWHPFRVVRTTAEAADRHYDYVVCAAKYIPDVITTPRLLEPLLPHTSTFVLLQNGIGVHEDLHRVAPTATIISVCAWVDATAINGGNVIAHGRMDRLDLGIHWPAGHLDDTVRTTSQLSLETFVDILVAGGCEAQAVDDIDAARWRKNLWNIGYSVFCTMTRSSVSTLLSDKWVSTTAPTVRGFMDEAVGVARAVGLSISDSAITYAEETTLREHAESHPERAVLPVSRQNFKPSMLVDLEAERPMEIEGILGGVVKKGREAGFHAPRLETAYATLSIIQQPLLLRLSNVASGK